MCVYIYIFLLKLCIYILYIECPAGVANAIGNEKKSIEDGLKLGKIRAANLGFRFPSYTPGEGNCFMEAIFEQLSVNPRSRHYAESAYCIERPKPLLSTSSWERSLLAPFPKRPCQLVSYVTL